VAGAQATGRSGCARFAGPRLLRSASIDVIARPVGEPDGGLGYEEMLVFACVPRAGHVWLVGIANDPGSGGYAYASVRAHAGTWAVVEFHDNQTPHESEQTYKLVNARTGTSHTFFREVASEIPGFEAHEGKESIEALKLNSFGQLLLETSDGAEPPTAQIIAEQPNGRRRRLDSGALSQIPPKSLSLAGRKAGWVDADGRHTATI
jgi:hypothetical protein